MEIDLDEVTWKNMRRVIAALREMGYHPAKVPDGWISKAATRLTKDEVRDQITAEEWEAWRNQRGSFERKQRRSAANAAAKGVPTRLERSLRRRRPADAEMLYGAPGRVLSVKR